MVGAIVVGNAVGHSEIRRGNAGATINYTGLGGDLLKFSSGELIPATAGDAIEGVARQDATSADQVYYQTGERLRILMDHDGDGGAPAATDVGSYYDIIGATGAQVVDTSSKSASTGQLRMIALNPQGYGFDSDASIGLFEINERL